MKRRVLPGFTTSAAITWFYLGVLLLLPLSALLGKAATLDPVEAWRTISAPRTLASLKLTFGASLLAAMINAVLGLLVAWVLARYRFRGRGLLDALIDLPFALPTAVAGLTLASIYAPNGLFGRPLAALGWKVAFSEAGVVLALVFVGFPFVVRTVEPVLADLNPAIEEAAAVLGASRAQTFFRVLLPYLLPSVLTGFALAFARAVGEYGSIVFISGNMPFRTEITPLLIVTKLEQYDYAGATALAVVMLLASFAMLLFINMFERWSAGQRGLRAR